MTREELLKQAVVGLFKEKCSTFLMVIYCGLKVVWDSNIPTACVDGITLRINEDWFRNMSKRMRVTVLAHELWHVAFFHCDPLRFGKRIFRLWNEACDHAINLMLKDHGYEFSIPHLGDYKYSGMTAEQIYRDLEQTGGELELPFGEDFALTPMEQDSKQDVLAVQNLVVRASVVARMQGGSAYGDLPGDVKKTIERILQPPLPWEKLLSKFVTERSDQGYTWQRPNRRFQGIYMPSRGSNTGLAHLMFAFDVSCSVTDRQISSFLAQLHHIRKLYEPKLITVLTFDTQIQERWTFTADFRDDQMAFARDGGTHTDCVMEVAMAERPTALIFFTDMEFAEPINPKIPTLWVCLDNPDVEAPFGKLIHLDSELNF